jgi:hypothetical protein
MSQDCDKFEAQARNYGKQLESFIIMLENQKDFMSKLIEANKQKTKLIKELKREISHLMQVVNDSNR